MKKLLLLLLFPVMMFGQEVSTTEEEYNYLTEGLKSNYKKGLDSKKEGYTLIEIDRKISKNSSNEFVFYKLLDSNNVTKAFSIQQISTKEDKQISYFWCMPLNNDKLFSKFFKEIKLNLKEKDFFMYTAEILAKKNN